MTIHHLAMTNLSDQERDQLSKEHTELEKYLMSLKNVCEFSNDCVLAECKNCNNEKLASCTGLLPSYLHDLHEIIFQHFLSEERILIKVLGEEEYLAHTSSHELLLDNIDKLISHCFKNNKALDPAKIYRDVYDKTIKLLKGHDEGFDKSFSNKISQQ